MRANLRDIAAAATFDPRQALLSRLDVAGLKVAHNLVLVAGYVEPEKTKGGIIKPDRSLMENRFQGKVGLVLKLGPLAFKDDGTIKFGGFSVQPGDWVIYRPSDTLEMFIQDITQSGDGVPCRWIEDALIKGKVEDPSIIY